MAWARLGRRGLNLAVPQRLAACLRSTQDRGWGWGWGCRPAGGGGVGPAPAGTMAKTVAYFYDPDVGNFHYGEGTGLYARGWEVKV